MGTIALNQDIELVSEERKSTDYLYEVIDELVERTGGRVVATERLVQVNVLTGTATATVIYTLPSDVVQAVINKCTVINVDTAVSDFTISISETDGTTIPGTFYEEVSIAAKETQVLPAMEQVVLTTKENNLSDRIVVAGSSVCVYHFSITELLR